MADVQLARRDFIKAAALGSAAVVVGTPVLALAAVKEVSPVEDLMREHGALNRILLIYEETLRRFRAKEEMDPALLKRAAKIIHDFIESYHEKLEEQHVFPRLKKAGKLVDTVDTLLAQHRAGRKLTEIIMTTSDHAALEGAMTKFIRMYRPHEAREDTIVFPEFKKLLTRKEYDKLGDEFEAKEHELFGKEGFEGVLVKIADIEKALGIYDLAKFTPK